MIWDQVFVVSGLFNEEVGGLSVKFYQLEGLWEEIIGGGGGSIVCYMVSEGLDCYCKSLYIFWKCIVFLFGMLIMDVFFCDLCFVKWQEINMFLQVLLLFNDLQVFEVSKVFVLQAWEQGGVDVEEWIVFMFCVVIFVSLEEVEL